jgi:hypothetical protein
VQVGRIGFLSAGAPGCWQARRRQWRAGGGFGGILLLAVTASTVPTFVHVFLRPRHHQPIRPTVASFYELLPPPPFPRVLRFPSPPEPFLPHRSPDLPDLPFLFIPSPVPTPSSPHRRLFRRNPSTTFDQTFFCAASAPLELFTSAQLRTSLPVPPALSVLLRCPAQSTASLHTRFSGSLSAFGTPVRPRKRHRHQLWRRSCDRRLSGLEALVCAAGRVRPNAFMRTAERPARTAQRDCTNAICLRNQ